jgi:DNA-binding transcriptional LysR family regulator
VSNAPSPGWRAALRPPFNRTTRSVALTDAGQRYVARIGRPCRRSASPARRSTATPGNLPARCV